MKTIHIFNSLLELHIILFYCNCIVYIPDYTVPWVINIQCTVYRYSIEYTQQRYTDSIETQSKHYEIFFSRLTDRSTLLQPTYR